MTKPITNIIQPKAKDIGEFEVRRALPVPGQRAVGPWVFFDHFLFVRTVLDRGSKSHRRLI